MENIDRSYSKVCSTSISGSLDLFVTKCEERNDNTITLSVKVGEKECDITIYAKLVATNNHQVYVRQINK